MAGVQNEAYESWTKDKIEKMKDVDMDMTFELKKVNNQWKITNIK